jgi:hypothetical protein
MKTPLELLEHRLDHLLKERDRILSVRQDDGEFCPNFHSDKLNDCAKVDALINQYNQSIQILTNKKQQ